MKDFYDYYSKCIKDNYKTMGKVKTLKPNVDKSLFVGNEPSVFRPRGSILCNKVLDKNFEFNIDSNQVDELLSTKLNKKFVTELRAVVLDGMVRNRVKTFFIGGNTSTGDLDIGDSQHNLLSYIFGAYIQSLNAYEESENGKNMLFVPIKLKEPHAKYFSELMMGDRDTDLTIPLNIFDFIFSIKHFLMGYVDNCTYKVGKGSITVPDNLYLRLVLDSTSLKYSVVHDKMLIYNLTKYLSGLSAYSLRLFMDVDTTVTNIFDMIYNSRMDAMGIDNEFKNFVAYYPGFVMHNFIDGNYSFKEYKTWDIKSFANGYSGEGEAFKKLHSYMNRLVKTIGLYTNEYSVAHVMVGSTTYSIPMLTDDFAYVMFKLYGIGNMPTDRPDRFDVWNSKLEKLKDKLNEFFTETFEEMI